MPAERKYAIEETTLIASLLLLAACAEIQPESNPSPVAPDARTFGVLDPVYDRAKWRWITNADGRALLTHTELQKCFLNPRPDAEFDDPGFTVKREQRTIGSVRYEIVSLFEKQDFWEAVYLRSGTKAPLLGVYAAGECQREAERILQAYEKAQQR